MTESEELKETRESRLDKGKKPGVRHTCDKRQRLDEVVARAVGTSRNTLHKVKTIDRLKPSLIAEIDAGKFSVHAAYQLVKRGQDLTGLDRRIGPLPEGDFDVIYADPPWAHIVSRLHRRVCDGRWPALALGEIPALSIERLVADAAALFLWATNPLINAALSVIRAWGFVYRAKMIWVTGSTGEGDYVRQIDEPLLIATRGNWPPPETSNRPSSVIWAQRSGNGERPDIVYELIEQMYPSATYVELFPPAVRPGWTAIVLEPLSAAPGGKGDDQVCGAG
jgi:N6-adenosine-specific RNA methylase IME4